MYELLDYEDRYEESLVKLWHDICVEEYGFDNWKNELSNVDKDLYEKIIIAVHDDTVIGSIAYKNAGNNVAEIKRVYVHPKYRGSGIAKGLLNLIIESIEENIYETIVLETLNQFNRAISFYEKNNFYLIEQDGDCCRYERKIERVKEIS